jgi:hypothetical protein
LDKVCAIPKAQGTKGCSDTRSGEDGRRRKGVIATCLRFRGGIWKGNKRGSIVVAEGLDHLCDTGYIVIGRTNETEEDEHWEGRKNGELTKRGSPKDPALTS